LDALLDQGASGVEIIVVDNASSDGSPDLVAERYPQVELIRNQSNLGYAGGCNAGIRASCGETLIVLNQDTRVHQGWLKGLVDAARRPRVGVVGCKILYPDGETLQHAGGWVEWPRGIAGHYGAYERDEGQWDAPRQVDYVTGAAMAFPRQVYDRVGPLDEGYWPGYYEDVDFCSSALRAGYEIWYTPEAVMRHAESTSIADSAARDAAFHRGRLRYVLKHLSPQRLVDEFAPQEQADVASVRSDILRYGLRSAYLEAIPVAATVLPSRWNANTQTIDRVLVALHQLYLGARPEGIAREPRLDLHQFRSAVPVLGPLISAVRSLWYSVAARWAVGHLIHQQEAINRMQHVINQGQEAINEQSARSIATLVREVAHLASQLEAERGSPAPGDVADTDRER
jgi:GT2 family glycosyltransferase